MDFTFFAAAKQQRLASSADRQYFLCVGWFIPEKNGPGLLEACARYQQQVGRWGLLLIGGGLEEDAIRAQVARLPAPEACQLRPFWIPWLSDAVLLPLRRP